MEGKVWDWVASGSHDSDQSGAVLGEIIWVKLDGELWWPSVVVDENAVSESNKPDVKTMGDVLVRLYGCYEYLYVDPNEYRYEFEIILEQNKGCYREIFRKSLEQDINHSKSARSKGRGSKSKGASNGRVDGSKERKASGHKNSYSGKAASARKTRAKSEPTGRSPKGNVLGKESTSKNSAKNANSVKNSSRKQITAERKTKTGNLNSKHNVEATGKTFKEGGVKRKLELVGAHFSRSPKQDEVPKKNKHNTPKSGETSAGRTEELSARRMKVMQTLALAAPSGSPFE